MFENGIEKSVKQNSVMWTWIIAGYKILTYIN